MSTVTGSVRVLASAGARAGRGASVGCFRLVRWAVAHHRWSRWFVIVAVIAAVTRHYALAVQVLTLGLLPGLVAVAWQAASPAGFERWCAGPWRRHTWRAWARKHWPLIADECGLSVTRHVETHAGEVSRSVVRPQLTTVSAQGTTLSLFVQCRIGQTPDAIAAVGPEIASAFNAVAVRTVQHTPTTLEVLLVMGDDLATPRTAAFPQAVAVDEVPVGRRQDGQPYVLTMKSRHTLFAGCSDSGKGSWLWGICGGLAPAVRSDLVRLWGIDLKGGMEVGMGAHLFTATAYTPGDAVAMLRHLLDIADKRTRLMRGASRFHRPTPGDPVHVLVIDELASLIAYETDAQKRTEAARLLSRLLSIGRAPGVLVVAFVQDPSKETVSMRNLFTQTVALRLRSAEETRMVLGDGMATKAPAHKIDETTPGVAWVVEGDHADRVRADYWTDDLIRAVAHEYPAPVTSPLPNHDDTHTGPVVAGETVTDTTTGRKPRKPRKPRAPRTQQDQDRTDEAA